MRAKMVKRAGDYRWSSFRAHGLGEADALLDRVEAYESLAVQGAARRRRRWSAYVHQTPEESELAAIRRSSETGLPFGERGSRGATLSTTGAGPDHSATRPPTERRTTDVTTPMHQRLVLGIGTDCCGGLSLVRALNQQPDTLVSYQEPPLLPWSPNWRQD